MGARIYKSLCLSLVILAAAATVWGAARENRTAPSLESVLRRLDTEAKDFHSLSAEVERTKVTVVVNDKSTETGTMLVRGDKMLLDIKTPSPRTILRNGDHLYVYTPGLKRVEEYNIGKHRALVDQLLLPGFGTSGKELEKSYLITVVGEPSLDDRKTVELELTPKSQEVRAQISRVQIWLDEATWLPIQQQFYETGSGDYSIVRYTKIVRNPDLSDSAFQQHWPKGTEKIKPQVQ
jgi:outer membrane lipoprotein-sorting protein